MSTIDVRNESRTDQYRQRVVRVDPGGRDVPAVLWTPAAGEGPFPLVLIGHGGGGHKTDDSRLDLAERYTSHGVAAAAIDGPWHGERQDSEHEHRGHGHPGRELDDERVLDGMVADWRTTLDALSALPEVDATRVGYGGVSMGTMHGLPFIASEPRIRAAVLGLCGLRRGDGSPLAIAGRLQRDARALACPVLFLLQWHDELFERAGSLELFDAIASPDRQLLANVGLHHETPARARAANTDFLVSALTTFTSTG